MNDERRDEAVTDMIRQRLALAGAVDETSAAPFPDPRFFCPLPWMRASVMPAGGVVPCCYAEGEDFANLRDVSMEEAWNSPAMRRMRLNMLRGVASPECGLCYEREKEGLRSHRQVALEANPGRLPALARTGRDGRVEPFEPAFLELRFSNVCNMRCRTCGPQFSTAWYDDARRLGEAVPGPGAISPASAPGALLEQIERALPHVVQIRFAGGEPLLADEHYDLLDLLVREKRTDIALSYHTNLSTLALRGRDVTDRWARFKSVLVRGSLDAAGARGEYIRKGLDWNVAVENRRRIAERCPNVRFLLFPTLSVLNVLAVLDLHRDWRGLGFESDGFQLNMLRWPRHYSVQILPQAAKRVVRRRYEDYALRELRPMGNAGSAVSRELQSASDHMTLSDESRLLPQFREATAKLDALRGEDLLRTFPEFAELLGRA
jgi:MoaA/NifB/PqqE/SkfB family radical SAM enzyme